MKQRAAMVSAFSETTPEKVAKMSRVAAPKQVGGPTQDSTRITRRPLLEDLNQDLYLLVTYV